MSGLDGVIDPGIANLIMMYTFSYNIVCDPDGTHRHMGDNKTKSTRRIHAKDIVKEVQDYLNTYSSAGMDINGGSHITNVPTFDKDDFISWKIRFLVFLDGFKSYLIITFEDGPFVPMSNLSTPANPLPKCQNQWSNAESRLANPDKRLKSIITGCLPNDVMKSVIKYKTAKEMWIELCLAYEGPSNTRDTKITALRFKFNAFKALEGEKLNGTYTRPKCLLNDLENNRVIISQYEDNDSDVEEYKKTNNESMANLNAEYHERTMLENQKRFYKRPGRVGSSRKPMDKSKETCFACGKLRMKEQQSSRSSVGKADARSGQWVDITMKKTCSKVTLDQLLSKQIPSNIVKAIRGKGRRKEINSKEVLFAKVDVSTSESTPVITSDSEDDSDNQVPLPPLPKLTGAEPSGASKSLISLSDLTANMADWTLNTASKRIKILLINCHKPIKMENLNNNRVKQLRSDNGTEFKNHTLEAFCDEKAARTMPNSAPLPKQFWREAVNGACYTQNRSIIVKRHRKTAYEVFRGRAPDISYFHAFGCLVHIHNHIDHLEKFDEKADDGFFLGYSSMAKAFKVFNIRRQEMEETFHVTFSEDNETISQTSTEGDAINFNEVNSFPDDEFSEPRTSDTLCSANTEYFPYVPAFDRLSIINYVSPEPIITSSPLIFSTSEDSSIPNIEDVVLAPDEVVHPELATTYESTNLQEDDKDEPIDDQPLLQVNSPLAESVSGLPTLVPKPYGKTIIGLKWVFKNKMDIEGVVTKNKARLVAKWYQANPKESNLVVVKRIFRKSTSGGCQILGGKLVCWSAKKQTSVAMSSAEVEYVAVSIFCDNTSAIAISNNPVLHSRTKHIDIKYHFIKDHILKGDIELYFIPTDLQLDDIFTKPLAEPSFTRLVAELAKLYQEPKQCLIPPSGEMNADDTTDKSLSRASEHPVTQLKVPTNLKTKKKKILSSSHPKSPYKEPEKIIEMEEDVEDRSMEIPTVEQLLDEVDKQIKAVQETLERNDVSHSDHTFPDHNASTECLSLLHHLDHICEEVSSLYSKLGTIKSSIIHQVSDRIKSTLLALVTTALQEQLPGLLSATLKDCLPLII
uniref:Retrovirus-related Pol polyprotein from transposon TNT 1-94 n=1 Tax=Tanacetum cinerariifolium TaxID=118510 RepID=A0A6L2KUA8_TANCI|nr:retrovirus-related Pol polyprotein from transposon TNT 1-94 [Tanacetum cinerariifolium]